MTILENTSTILMTDNTFMTILEIIDTTAQATIGTMVVEDLLEIKVEGLDLGLDLVVSQVFVGN